MFWSNFKAFLLLFLKKYFPVPFPRQWANLLRVVQKVSPRSTPPRSPRSSADVRCPMSCTVRAPVDRLSTAEYFSAFKALPDIFGLCLCDKRKIIKINDLKKFSYSAQTDNAKRMWMSRITNCVCERVWVHIWACFCLWAVIENGQGLFLSGLIRGSCFSHLLSLHPGLIFHLFFLLFPYCSSFFLLLLDWEKVQHLPPSLVLHLFFCILSHISQSPNDWLLTGWSMNTHTPAWITSNLLPVLTGFSQVFRYLFMVVLMGPVAKHKTKHKSKLIWKITEIKRKWFRQQWHFSWFASKLWRVRHISHRRERSPFSSEWKELLYMICFHIFLDCGHF